MQSAPLEAELMRTSLGNGRYAEVGATTVIPKVVAPLGNAVPVARPASQSFGQPMATGG